MLGCDSNSFRIIGILCTIWIVDPKGLYLYLKAEAFELEGPDHPKRWVRSGRAQGINPRAGGCMAPPKMLKIEDGSCPIFSRCSLLLDVLTSYVILTSLN